MIKTAEIGQMARFLTTAVGGLVLDLAVASAMILIWAFSDPVAAFVGLGCGMVFNYFVHLSWTFKDQNKRASFGHFLRFAVGVGVVLVFRIGLLWAMEAYGMQAYLHPTIRLGIAAGLSFVFSYLICSRLIFRNQSANPDTEGLY
ncbi:MULTISPECIES: GtrA family protein [unclassified Ruegeria]|uniref:GtrA family protein n=1 Tax=unclassified Ruegeria TaxID=2625375 RepID=UPI00148924A0|nr:MULTISPECIES: GtrA family protein [unclassified Ruegeria]